jgi:hypothetical protein
MKAGAAHTEDAARRRKRVKSSDGSQRSREVFKTPPTEWIADRIEHMKELLERRTARSAQALRGLLGPISLEPVTADIGRRLTAPSRASTRSP